MNSTNDTFNNDARTNTSNNDTKNTEPEPFIGVPNPIEHLESEFISVSESNFRKGTRVRQMTFAEWNAKQEPINRILYPTAFDMNPVNVKMGQVKKGTTEGKDENGRPKTIEYNYVELREDLGKGREKFIQLTSPALISRYGYTIHKTSGGEILSIGATADLENPHHRHWIKGPVDSVIDAFVIFILKNPSQFGQEINPIGENYDRTDPEFIVSYQIVSSSLAKLFRVPKNGEEQDLLSNIRNFYINPSDYVNKQDPTKSSHMKVYLPGTGDKPFTKEQLELICKGYELDPETGETILKEPKGFEFSFRWLFSRGTKTSKLSLTPKGTSIYIHRFFPCPERKTAETVHLKDIQKTIDEDFSRFVGISGFADQTSSGNAESAVPQNTSFQPMMTNSSQMSEDSKQPPQFTDSSREEPTVSLPSDLNIGNMTSSRTNEESRSNSESAIGHSDASSRNNFKPQDDTKPPSVSTSDSVPYTKQDIQTTVSEHDRSSAYVSDDKSQKELNAVHSDSHKMPENSTGEQDSKPSSYAVPQQHQQSSSSVPPPPFQHGQYSSIPNGSVPSAPNYHHRGGSSQAYNGSEKPSGFNGGYGQLPTFNKPPTHGQQQQLPQFQPMNTTY